MTELNKAFSRSIKIIKSDYLVILYSLVPILIGLILNVYFGIKGYTQGLDYIKAQIQLLFAGNTALWVEVLTWFLIVLFTVFFWVLMNWLMIIVISIIASPFNQLISARVSQIYIKNYQQTSNSISKLNFDMNLFFNFFWIIFNEIKKMIVVIFFSVLAFFLNLIPILSPLSLLIMALLLSFTFLDLSFSLYDWSLANCLKHIGKNIFKYSIAGLIFLGLISIPILNLFVVPFAAVFFTILFIENK